MTAPREASARITDPEVLRGLAHPLRRRILGALRLDGPATASGLGDRLGESSGATSYHLRALARYGLVEEVEGRGTARERWWQALHRSSSWDSGDFSSPDGAEAARELEREIVDVRRRVLTAWLDQRDRLPEPFRHAGSFSDLPLRLTLTEAQQLVAELDAVLVRWRDRERVDPGDEPTCLVAAFADAVPLVEYPL